MENYAESKENENTNPNRKPYSLISNNCGTFARDVVDQDDDLEQPSIWINTPVNIVNKYIGVGNSEVDYDPITNSTNIGGGDESKAKKSGKGKTAGDDGENNGPSWSKLGDILKSWKTSNPNIQITYE
jgi:hypothetical protein